MSQTPPTQQPQEPASAEQRAAAFAAVLVALSAIRPDTRDQARQLHAGYLTSQGIGHDDIEHHWNEFGGKYTD